MFFQDRRDAGRQLAARLMGYRHDNPIVLALPRGGVVAGFEVAKALRAPLEVLVVRKLAPLAYPEYAIGAIAPDDIKVVDRRAIRALGISEDQLRQIEEAERAELKRRMELYRGNGQMADLQGRTAVILDDGLATGMTAHAAVQAVRKRNPKYTVLAVPVCSLEAAEALRREVDALVCVATAVDFGAVGQWYAHFEQTTDEEVIRLLQRAQQAASGEPLSLTSGHFQHN
jgi:putative phosphoribosyl transferase